MKWQYPLLRCCLVTGAIADITVAICGRNLARSGILLTMSFVIVERCLVTGAQHDVTVAMCGKKLARSSISLAIPVVMMERCLVTGAKPDITMAMCSRKLARSGISLAMPFVMMERCFISPLQGLLYNHLYVASRFTGCCYILPFQGYPPSVSCNSIKTWI